MTSFLVFYVQLFGCGVDSVAYVYFAKAIKIPSDVIIFRNNMEKSFDKYSNWSILRSGNSLENIFDWLIIEKRSIPIPRRLYITGAV